MAKKYSPKPTAGQSSTSASRDADTSGVPVTGFIEAPTFDDGIHNFETGPGVPGNSATKMH